MPIDETKLAALQALEQPAVAEILAVYWDYYDSDTYKYYAITEYSDLVPFRECSLRPIEARLMGNQFHEFEINGDLRDESINFTFWNADKVISNLFQTYGNGARCELFYYYPDVDLLTSVWWGELHKGEGDYQVLPVTASNGYKSRELPTPHGKRAEECNAIYGYHIKTVPQIEVNLCPYDRHLGGTEGLLDGEGNPIKSCARLTPADCTAHFGHSRYFAGYDWTIQRVVTDGNSGYQAIADGQGRGVKDPVRVIAGGKHVHAFVLLFFRRELNASNPDRGFVRVVAEVGEGEIEGIWDIKLQDKFIEALHIQTRFGARGQPPLPSSLWADIPNFSGRAVFSAAYGWVDPATLTGQQIKAFAKVHGYKLVAVFSDEDSYSRIWSNQRAFWLLEFYTNPRIGRGEPHDKFWIEDFITVADWHAQYVRFVHPDPTASIQNFDYYRDEFGAIIEGRPSADVIADICRSGRMSVPFQYEGKYTVVPFRAATEDELTNAKVFTDTGEDRNICFEGEISGDLRNKQPSLRVSDIPNNELINEIQVTFEAADNLDSARTITVDDPNQQRLAGGGNDRKAIPTTMTAFGVRFLNITVKLAYGWLWFGEFDEGGIKNNCKVRFTAWHIHTLGLKKYDFIKVESAQILGYGYTDYTDPDEPVFTQFEYFRILNMKKRSNNSVEIIAQAYNHEAYEDFETVISTPEGAPAPNEIPDRDPNPNTCKPTFSATYLDGLIQVDVDPC